MIKPKRRILNSILGSTVIAAEYGLNERGEDYLRIEFDNKTTVQAKPAGPKDRLRVMVWVDR